MTGDFHENEIDEYGWNNGVSDYPTLFDGTDMVCYEESIRPAVEQYTGNLMSYFYKQRNPGIKEKVISAIPSIEIRNGELMGCTTVVLKEPLADEEMEDLQDYLHGQFPMAGAKALSSRKSRLTMVCCMFILEKQNHFILK